jgi:hypothetical protein
MQKKSDEIERRNMIHKEIKVLEEHYKLPRPNTIDHFPQHSKCIFSVVNMELFRTDHVSGHKRNINKFKRTEII